MSELKIPKGYKPALNLYETQKVIKTVKDCFQGLLSICAAFCRSGFGTQ